MQNKVTNIFTGLAVSLFMGRFSVVLVFDSSVVEHYIMPELLMHAIKYCSGPVILNSSEVDKYKTFCVSSPPIHTNCRSQ